MLNLTAASGLFQWVVNAAQSAWDVRYGTGLSGGGGDGRQAILPVIPGTKFICSAYCEQFSVATIAAV